jgi:hypothetical protein
MKEDRHPSYIHEIEDVSGNIQKKYEFAKEIPGSLFYSIVFPPNFCYTTSSNIISVLPSKPEIIINDGILDPKSGPLSGKCIGAKNGSIIHDLWKQSPELALYIISDIQQITDRWFPIHGFSIGIQDCF